MGLISLVIVFFTVLTSIAYADDTEIYFLQKGSESASNILFILDSSGSMNFALDGSTLKGGASHPQSRYQIMLRTLENTLELLPENLNIGVLNYGGHFKTAGRSNGVKYPIRENTELTRQEFMTVVESFKSEGWTPIVHSLYEAASYYKGMPSIGGNSENPDIRAHPDSRTQGTYHVEYIYDVTKKWCDLDAVNSDNTCVNKDLTGYCRQTTSVCANTACDELNLVPDSCTINYNYCFKDLGECNGKPIIENECQDVTSRWWWCNFSDGRCGGRTLNGNCRERTNTRNCIGGYNENGECLEYAQYTQCQYTQNKCPYPNGQQCTYYHQECQYKIVKSRFKLSGKVQYISPIKTPCQKNFIILMTDGTPDDGIGTDDQKDSIVPTEYDSRMTDRITTNFGVSCNAISGELADGTCGPEFTQHLATVDQVSDDKLEGDQLIYTYVIGFGVNDVTKAYLKNLSNNGVQGEAFYEAGDELALINAFKGIFKEITQQSNTFSPPAISIDPNNLLQHSNAVYSPLFIPENTPFWPGNLKKYLMDGSHSPARLLGCDNQPILNAFGEVKPSARSCWIPEDVNADGEDVEAGGAAALLGDNRNLYTNSVSDALVSLEPTNVQYPWLGLSSSQSALRETYVNFARGMVPEESTQNYPKMGSILHSDPVVVCYEKSTSGNQCYVFVGTNQGYLHAFDTETGEESFAFIPHSLLINIPTLYGNNPGTKHPYGMDGSITVWRNDKNNDGNINSNEGDFVYLYVGMRRGGRNYYALDITNPQSPTLKWVIRGGENLGFDKLGQTWSKPELTTVEYLNGTNLEIRTALIFGGGYDPAQDEIGGRQDDSMGNAIYIVDAKTGDKLWSISNTSADVLLSSMKNSIPADIQVLDIDANGVADRLYAADMGGRVFRIDLPDSKNKRINAKDIIDLKNGGTIKGNLFADLGGADLENNRRFYYKPDYVMQSAGGKRFATISLGSGYRARPLTKGEEATQDRLFVLFDTLQYGVPDGNFEAIDNTQLTDITTSYDTKIGNYGWYINLKRDEGEKALARATTLDNKIFFTTFIPEKAAGENICASAMHMGNVYALDILSGKSVMSFSSEEASGGEASLNELSIDDRFFSVTTVDILSHVYFHVSKNEENDRVKINPLVGNFAKYPISPMTFDSLLKVYWEEEK